MDGCLKVAGRVAIEGFSIGNSRVNCCRFMFAVTDIGEDFGEFLP